MAEATQMPTSVHETEADNQAAELRLAEKEGRILAHWKTMVRLLQAVKATDFEGIQCGQVEGQNWFDLRDKVVNRIEDDGTRLDFTKAQVGTRWRTRCGEVWKFTGIRENAEAGIKVATFDDEKGRNLIFRKTDGTVERDGTLHNYDVVAPA